MPSVLYQASAALFDGGGAPSTMRRRSIETHDAHADNGIAGTEDLGLGSEETEFIRGLDVF